MSPVDDTPGAVQNFTVHGGFALGVIGADLHVFGSGVPVYLLRNWRPAPTADSAWLRELPSRMLNARFAVVDFVGRDGELAVLHRWRLSSSRRAIRWLYGHGGSGKTRLADQLAGQARSSGWKVAVATPGPGAVMPPPGSEDLRLADHAGLLLLVDYADRWPLEHLTCLLSNSLLHDRTVPVRVLMLARDLDGWREIRGALGNEQFFTSSQQLGPLANEAQQVAMFTTARNCFAALYELPDPEMIMMPAMLHQTGMDLILDTLMAALVAVDAHRGRRKLPAERGGLTGYLLDREHLHWVSKYGHRTHRLPPRRSGAPRKRTYRTPPPDMHQIVFAAGLAGPVPAAVGGELLDRLCPDLSVDTATALADHVTCYPPSDGYSPGAGATMLEPLYPDRLAEDFLALTIPGHDVDYPAQEWAPAMVTRLFSAGDDVDELRAATRALTFLAAAAERWRHLPDTCLDAAVRQRPDLVVRAGPATLRRLARLGGVTVDALEAVEKRLPAGRHVGYETAAAAVTDRIVTRELASTDDPAQRAALLAKRGIRSAYARQDGQAGGDFAALAPIVARFAQADPLSHSWNLAAAYSNLATSRRHSGQLTEAVAAARAAVEVRERMAGRQPSKFLPSYAAASYQLALLLVEDGDDAQAGAAVAELDQFCRGVADTFPGRRSGDLARLLAPTAVFGEAAVAADDFAALCRATAWAIAGAEQQLEALFPQSGESVGQAAERTGRMVPVAFLADIATALHTEHQLLSAIDETKAAFAACLGAVEFFRLCAGATPAEHVMSLSQTLRSAMDLAAAVGREADACGYGAESVEGYQVAAGLDGPTYDPDLAAVLTRVSRLFLNGGEPEEALHYSERAISALRRVADRTPDHLPLLADACGWHGMLATTLGQHDTALSHTQTSVDLHQALRRRGGAEHDAGLALALARFGLVRIAAEEDRAEAVEAVLTASQLYEELKGYGGAAGEELAVLLGAIAQHMGADNETNVAESDVPNGMDVP